MSGQQYPPVPETTPLPPAARSQAGDQPSGQHQAAPHAGAGDHQGAPQSEARRNAQAAEPATAAIPEPAPGRGTGWGAPPTGSPGDAAANPKPWTMKRGLVVAGAATVLAAGAGAGVYSLGSNAAAANGTAASGAGGQGGLAPGGVQRGGVPQGGFANGAVPGQGGDFAPGGLGGMGSGVSSAVHSEYVIEEGSQYVTKVAQLGTVANVSSGSVTVKSADGFTRTYTVGEAIAVSNQQQRRQQSSASGLTVADIAAGATVRIVAAKEGSAFAAETVQLIAALQTGQTGQTS
ncbi:hypothetical protein ABFP37_10835 [Burkholderia sp. RS01]|uniref:hypothetical protein n=1 Tax=unclassified Burkholderia TaxID=2613784 RepID=UPI0032186950